MVPVTAPEQLQGFHVPVHDHLKRRGGNLDRRAAIRLPADAEEFAPGP